ncbi:MAG: c-type cytochrome biogenesis protein CcmI [Acidiferrobacterales bacterium]
MVFWIIVTILMLIALAIATIPYWRKLDTAALDSSELNIILYKRRLAELELDLINDVLDQEQYDASVSELKLQLLSDIPEGQEKTSSSSKTWSKQTILATFLLIPALSISLYILLGNKDIATGNVEVTGHQQSPDIKKMIAGIQKRLEAEPGNVRGWTMLGRTYAAINQFDKAVAAYEKAYKLAPADADILTGLAESLAIVQDNKLQGRPFKLIEKALKINKKHPRALWLAGHAQMQLGNNKKAVAYWQTLLTSLPPDHESAQKVRQFISELGGEAGSSVVPASKDKKPGQDKNGIRVKVRLAKNLKNVAPQNATLFIFARAAKGPRMPLAGKKLRVSDLPTEIVLNDDSAMIPGKTISSVNQIIVGARISRSGGPISKPGDLEGFSPVISSAHPETLEVVINQIAQ